MRALVVVLLLVLALPAWSQSPSERLDDPVLEARARALFKELRCLVCQNQSIDKSPADLAKDLRMLVRERIVAGDTDEEVLTFLTDRYGPFVRLRPPFTIDTLALWLGPFAIALVAAIAGVLYLRHRRNPADGSAPLSAEEEAELAAVLERRRHA